MLYVEGCPGYRRVLARLDALVAAADLRADIVALRVATPDAAVAACFLGSPTVRVDGVDVEPAAGTRPDYGLMCRLYPSADGLRNTPADESIAQALARARAR